MGEIERGLDSVVGKLSDQNYEQSLALYRLWFEIGQTYSQFPPDQIFGAIWNNRSSRSIDPASGKLIHPTAHLILRFAKDAESDDILGPHSAGLQDRLCTRILRDFFEDNMRSMPYSFGGYSSFADLFIVGTNLVAHWANLGYVNEVAIRKHILQSLTFHPKLHDHQADALIVLFKLAGATFGMYADPSLVDRCFELLKGHYNIRDSVKGRLVQEVVALRERGWEGLPPPPVFTTQRPILAGADQGSLDATPVATPQTLPNGDLEPQIPQPPPLESVIAIETDTVPVSPAAQSPSSSIATLSDFTIADTSDDESPIDLTAITSHDIFYLEDGNVEVLCGNTLFRVHTSFSSFHSPVLGRMLARANLATAESPNGYPRITSSETATDFATLLKMIYLPGFPERNKVPDFNTFSSLLRTTAKYELPTVRSQLLEVVRDAYPETFEGLTSSKPLGECIFSGPAPHPNEVLNLFVQQKLASALPMAYYMAARRGLDSLMDRSLPQSATLSPEILHSAIGGLMTLREMERDETNRLVFGPKDPTHPCFASFCPSLAPTCPRTFEIYQKVFDHVLGSSQPGTNILVQAPEFYEDRENGPPFPVFPKICDEFMNRLERGHADLRKKAWTMLPDVFGLRG